MSARPQPAPARKPIARPPANYFSIPNAVVDKLLACAEPAEVYCYLVILRETAGRNRAEAEVRTDALMRATKLSERGVLSALQALRAKQVIRGGQGRYSMVYDESEWQLTERTGRTRAPRKPSAEPAVETVTARCNTCGVEGEHGRGCTASTPVEVNPANGDEKAKDAPECMLEQGEPSAQHAPECMLGETEPSVSSELHADHDELVAYLTEAWVPVFHVAPSPAQIAAIECKLGDSPLHCFMARCEHRRVWLSQRGRGYAQMVLMADDSRSEYALLRAHNVRSIKRAAKSALDLATEYAAERGISVEEAIEFLGGKSGGG